MLWMLLLVGGVAAWFGIRGMTSTKLECPACDLYIHDVMVREGGAVLCPHCREYALYEAKALVKPPVGYVAAAPGFCVELPQRLQWPDGCCVCAQAATRVVPVTLQLEQDGNLGTNVAVGIASLGFLKMVDRTTYALDVPHCAQHADGAELTLPYEPAQVMPGIAFRSYPYYAAFKQLNRTTARKQTMFSGGAGGV